MSVVEDYIRSLGHAKEIKDRYEEHYREPICSVVQAIAATIFIEANKRAKATRAKLPQADNAPGFCPLPNCHGEMWDNREDKASGKIKATYPDYKCKECGHAIWLDSKKKNQRAAAKQDEGPRGPEEDPAGDDLPF